MRASLCIALLAALLGPAPAGAAEDDRGLGSPSLSPWYAPGRVARRDGRWFPAFSEAPEQRPQVRAPASGRDDAFTRGPDHLPYARRHPGFAILPRPAQRPRPASLPDPAADAASRAVREPAWKTRWTPWGYRPNYIGLGGSLGGDVGQRSRARPGQTGIANPAITAPTIPQP